MADRDASFTILLYFLVVVGGFAVVISPFRTCPSVGLRNSCRHASFAVMKQATGARQCVLAIILICSIAEVKSIDCRHFYNNTGVSCNGRRSPNSDFPLEDLEVHGSRYTHLFLAAFQVPVISKDFFEDFPNVIELKLQFNSISSIHPGAFNGLERVETLSLALNRIPKLRPDTFQGILGLRRLDLSSNKLTVFNRTTLPNLVGLVYLFLQNNKFHELQPSMFAGLNQLTELDLSQNKISKIQPDTFADLANLQELNLHSNRLKFVTPPMFAGLIKLKSLDLLSNSLVYALPFPLSRFPAKKLSKLGLGDNRLLRMEKKCYCLMEEKRPSYGGWPSWWPRPLPDLSNTTWMNFGVPRRLQQPCANITLSSPNDCTLSLATQQLALNAAVGCSDRLPTVSNGRIRPPTQSTFPLSTDVTCDPGYDIDGASSVTCNVNGTWSNPGECRPVDCKSPIIANAQSYNVPSGTTYGNIAKITCQPGYTRNGKSGRLTCSIDGKWRGFVCAVTDQTCNVMRDSQLSASIFTRKQLTSTGANRMAATLQEAAAACQEVGLDILHYIPERNCSNLDNNSATRDLNARKLNRYAITCQRPMQICPWYGTLQVPKNHDFRKPVTFSDAEKLCRDSNSNGRFILARGNHESRYCMDLLLQRMMNHFRMPTKPQVWWLGEGNENERRHVVCRIQSSNELLPGAIERCGNFGTLQLPSYHDFMIRKTFDEASKICQNLNQEIPVFSPGLKKCMARLQRKMQHRIGSATPPGVWFHFDGHWTTKRNVVCFVPGSQWGYTAQWPNVELANFTTSN